MLITNVTDIRNNIGKVIKTATDSKEPVIIMQRSKPVAYILEKSIYDEMQRKLKEAEEREIKVRRCKSLESISLIREKTKEYNCTIDSTVIIRELREKNSHE